MTIDQQVALNEALVPHASRLRIGKSNFHPRSYITSKESILQLVYDVLKHIVSLEYFKEMMHICPRHPDQSFDELPFEEEILAFLRFLRHIEEIRKLSDVNINKLHQPCRSFAAVINKCLSGKSIGYDSLQLSQAQILWGMYHKKNVDFAYLLWEDFVYKVKHKDAKKSNKMYYPRHKTLDFCKRQTTCKGLQIKSLTVLSEVAMTEAKHIKLAMKRSLQQIHISQASSSGADEGTGIILRVPDVPTEESGEEISWKSSNEDDDDVDERSDDQDDDEDQDDDDQDDDDQDEGNDDDQDSDNEGDEFVHPKLSIHEEEETKDEESFDPIVQTPENSDDEGNDDASLGLIVGSEEGQDAEDDEDELYRDVNINLERRDVQITDVHTTQEFEDTHVTLSPVNPDGQQQSSSVSS
nr:hypothetical protein [Tanacetum cinerariifolium]